MRRARIVRIEWKDLTNEPDGYPSENLFDPEWLKTVLKKHYNDDFNFTVTGEPSFEVEEEKG